MPTCRRQYPGGPLGRIARGTAYSNRFPAPQRRRPSPLGKVGAHIGRFEACSTFTRVTACLLAASPAAHLSRRLRRLRYLHRRSDSYRLEQPSCRVGVAPTEDQHLFTAHTRSDPDGCPRSRGFSGLHPDRTPIRNSACARSGVIGPVTDGNLTGAARLSAICFRPLRDEGLDRLDLLRIEVETLPDRPAQESRSGHRPGGGSGRGGWRWRSSRTFSMAASARQPRPSNSSWNCLGTPACRRERAGRVRGESILKPLKRRLLGTPVVIKDLVDSQPLSRCHRQLRAALREPDEEASPPIGISPSPISAGVVANGGPPPRNSCDKAGCARPTPQITMAVVASIRNMIASMPRV